MKNNMQILHFTIGPVQGFVAQARRIRDLWAGSFLLSFLSAHAMREVLENGGHIVFPHVGTLDAPSDDLLKAVLNKSGVDSFTPSIGSIPNRFKAHVPENFDPKAVVQAVQDRWQLISQAVFSALSKEALEFGDKSVERQTLWQQQIKSFWDITWVMGDVGTEIPNNSWLDARKNWRSHFLPDQTGEKCSLMGDWQELSTYSVFETKERKEFWQIIAKHTHGGHRNIRDGEYLCAISLVKRIFPTLQKKTLIEVIGWVPSGNLKALSNWPSTTYMAALPWLLSVYNNDQAYKHLLEYTHTIANTVEHGENLQLILSEQANHFTKFTEKVAQKSSNFQANSAIKPHEVDGDLFNPHSLQNAKNTPLSVAAMHSGIETPEDKENRIKLFKSLKSLFNKLSKITNVDKRPRAYYAILLMDGDSLGRLLQTYGDQATQKISTPLAEFTKQVDIKVKQHVGITLYAGGDDVLALLPLNKAIACAEALNASYRTAFKKASVPEATASTAILFTHHQYPLANALEQAHALLDGIAKDENGRDSLVISVLNSGGEHLRWVNTWSAPNNSVNATKNNTTQEHTTSHSKNHVLNNLVEIFEQAKLSRTFPHKLQQQYPFLAKPAESSEVHTPKVMQQLATAEILMSEPANGRTEKQKRANAEYLAQEYLSASLRYKRIEIKHACQLSSIKYQPVHAMQYSAGLLARFITKQED